MLGTRLDPDDSENQNDLNPQRAPKGLSARGPPGPLCVRECWEWLLRTGPFLRRAL